LENFQEAMNVYKGLHSNQETIQQQNDLRINASAVDAQLEWQGLGYLASNRTVQKDDMQAFERAYNAACGSIARSKFQEAEILLARAKRMTCKPALRISLTFSRTLPCV
jgi:signal recognition particle subunit SRP72